jgi:hypothetical protein
MRLIGAYARFRQMAFASADSALRALRFALLSADGGLRLTRP